MSPVDRFGEPIDVDEVDEPEPEVPPPCGCDGGWVDRDADHPVPCYSCRPHLAPGRRAHLH